MVNNNNNIIAFTSILLLLLLFRCIILYITHYFNNATGSLNTDAGTDVRRMWAPSLNTVVYPKTTLSPVNQQDDINNRNGGM